jgi:hypothetical protein
MSYLVTWNYKGKRHYEKAQDKRSASKVKRNVPLCFSGATNIHIQEAKEVSYAEIKRLEKAMGVK